MCSPGWMHWSPGIPGFKAVAGRTVRKFTDDAAVASRVENAGMDPWERKLLGVTALEKMLGKKKFSELLADLVSRPEGKPVLVPASDKRPEVVPAEKEFANLNDMEREDESYE